MGLIPLLALLLSLQAAPLRAPTPTEIKQAREAYKEGRRLLESGQEEQAYEEFKQAHQLSGIPDALLGMAQTQYHLGFLKESRALYQRYLDHPDHNEEWEAHARARIAAIDSRKSVLSLHTVPDGVDVKIFDATGALVESGQAPNRFDLPHGRYNLVLSKPNYVTQTRQVDVAIADAMPLFFALAPVPGRLEIRTRPRGATLYVRGNRTQNPYAQAVEPGEYEIYAEARDYESRREVVRVGAGQVLRLDFPLTYVQRSGRPELIAFWTAAGALAGGSGVLARLSRPADSFSSYTASATVVAAGSIVGGVAGGLIATAYSPSYIRDNLAMFRIGALWIGAAEGAMIGLTVRPDLRGAWIGGASGIGAGAIAGTLLDERAPNYGRVMVIQSAAAFGILAGLLAVPAFAADLGLSPRRYRPHAVLAGLNLGLAAGLSLAYLPDQSVYGPTWNRTVLVDLAGAAGAFAGALASTLGDCLEESSTRPNGNLRCEFRSTSRTAKFTLAGTGAGLLAGWALTRGYDKDVDAPSERSPALPVPTALVVPTPTGGTSLVPGVAAQGRF